MFAMAREGYFFEYNRFCIVMIEGEGFVENGERVLSIAREEFFIGSIYSFRGVDKTFPSWVIAGPFNESPNGL